MSTKKKASDELIKIVGKISFGMFVRSARLSMDLTQTEMAEMLDISKSNLCDIEKGRQLVSLEFAKKVAKKAKLSEEIAVQTCIQDQLKKAKLRYNIHLEEAS